MPTFTASISGIDWERKPISISVVIRTEDFEWDVICESEEQPFKATHSFRHLQFFGLDMERLALVCLKVGGEKLFTGIHIFRDGKEEFGSNGTLFLWVEEGCFNIVAREYDQKKFDRGRKQCSFNVWLRGLGESESCRCNHTDIEEFGRQLLPGAQFIKEMDIQFEWDTESPDEANETENA